MFLVFKWCKFDARGGWNDFDQAYMDRDAAFAHLEGLANEEWMGHVVDFQSKAVWIEIDPTTGEFPQVQKEEK